MSTFFPGEETLRTAINKHKQGQWDDAETLYRQILAVDPCNTNVLSLMSLIHEQKGDTESALHYGHQAIQMKPNSANLYVNLAQLLLNFGREDEAIPLLEKALQIDKRNIEAMILLGNTYQHKRDFNRAVEWCKQALRLNRSEPILYSNLGNALQALGRYEESIGQYQRAIGLNHHFTDAHFNLGVVYYSLKRFSEAANCFREALAIDPDYYRAHTMLGTSLSNLGQCDEALKHYQIALKMTPTPAENMVTLYNLGNLYKTRQLFDKACNCYEMALKINPDYTVALQNLAQTYVEQGKTEEALALYDRLLVIHPGNHGFEIARALCLPPFYESDSEIEVWRKRFEHGIDALLAREYELDSNAYTAAACTFYLNYHGRNDRVLMEKTGRLFQRILPPQEMFPSGQANTKLKIGFISRHLQATHTIGKLILGIVHRLDRKQFQITLFSVGPEMAYTPTGEEYPEDTFVTLPLREPLVARDKILQHNLDVLLYVDLGMEPSTYCLAQYRLAKVQCVTWGHPVTSGLKTIDYFISSRLIESENAQEHYTETLVQMETLPTYYYRPMLEKTLNRSYFGLPEDAHLYLCPQSLFKLHPDFDPLIAEILRHDSQGLLVLISHYSNVYNELLMARFRKTMSDVYERIRILPRQNRDEFMNLLALADVMLDPLYFGGGNTTYEALAFGTPIVTWPAAAMRGRVTAGCYRRMDLADCIAQSAEEYVSLAVRLGTNLEARRQMRDQILASCDVLYEDASAVTELEAFFREAVQRAVAVNN